MPVFFVATGLTFPVDQLFSDATTALRVPLFLAMLLVVRGVPALLFRREVGRDRGLFPPALLQATSLSFIVVAAQIGVAAHEIKPVNAASLVVVGMLSVLIFPAWSLARFRASVRRVKPSPRPATP